MHRFVVSTVGTSLLSNQIHPKHPKSWKGLLDKTANWTEERIKQHEPEVINILLDLKNRAEEKLNSGNILEIRDASAELNGIYGLYGEDLKEGKSDEHLLVSTDTYQGRESSELLKNFLESQEIYNTKLLIPTNISTANTTVFTQGIAKLITEIDHKINHPKTKGKTICFNLVGGFKALQGYMNTIGMFYADEIIYIFEGKEQELIKIPKLPLKIDINEVEPYKLHLAIMDAEIMPASWEDMNKVPEEWKIKLDQEIFLSPWGQIIWNKSKNEILSQENLLNFQKYKLDYAQSFKDDYKKTRNPIYKINLQEKLASIAGILCKYRDGISALREDGGIRLRRYKNTEIEHFNVNDSLRVSCKVMDGGRLLLRYYGTHDHVERSEGIR